MATYRAALAARVESTHDDGSPHTLRDKAGGLWRVVADAADGTLAVEEVREYGGGSAVPAVAQLESVRPGVAAWRWGAALHITPVADVGENYTDPARYEAGNGDVYVATSDGWRVLDEIEGE